MLDLAYYGLSAYACLFLIYIFYKAGSKNGNGIKYASIVGGVISLWFVYVYLLIDSGFLLDYSLPPRFPLLIIIPFILMSVIIYRKLRSSTITKHIPQKGLVYFQSFRVLVEIMLYYTFIEGVIPESATFDGYNFDIIMGISAPIVALSIYKNVKKNYRLVRSWNILGITMILLVAVVIGTSMYLPDMWGSNSPLVSEQFLSFPYFLIAGCIAPFAILVHVIALAQLKASKLKA